MTITILQDHTDFFERVLAMAMEDNHGLPLSIEVLSRIRTKLIVCRYRGKLHLLEQLRSMATGLPEGAERRAIAKAMAAGVEGEMEGWYCIADNSGVAWLEGNYAGPVLRWNGAVWWGRLKNIEIDTEVVTHEAFKARRKRRQPGRGAAEKTGAEGRPVVPGSSGFRRHYVPAIE